MRRWRKARRPAGARVPHVTQMARVVRGLRPDRNPLRRRVDRIESIILIALVAIFLAAAPLTAMGVGRWAWDGAAAAARSEQAAWHPVTAVLLRGVPRPQDNPYGAVYLAQVPARWTARDGAARTGEVTAVAGSLTGSKVTIWTSPSGAQTGPPLDHAQIDHQAVFAGLLAVLGLGSFLIVTVLVIRKTLQRRRIAAWDAEWRATGPLWSNYR